MPHEIQKSFVDYYHECGGCAHFIVLSVILFIAVALHVVSKKKNSGSFIVPCSILPLIIGICGTSFYLQRFLTSMLSHSDDQARWQRNMTECLHPIVAGSFLSALFIILTPIILYYASKPKS